MPKPTDVIAQFLKLANPNIEAGGGYKGSTLFWWKWLPIADLIGFIIPDTLIDLLPGDYGRHSDTGSFQPNYKDNLLALAQKNKVMMASIFYRMGMLPTDRCIVRSAPSLFGVAVGQAQKLVEKSVEEALGGVLLIDEAYELGKPPYGDQALTKLVAMLEEDDYKGKFVCILAGYPQKMQEMRAFVRTCA